MSHNQRNRFNRFNRFTVLKILRAAGSVLGTLNVEDGIKVITVKRSKILV